MSNPTILPTDLAEMTVGQLATMTPAQQQEALISLQELQSAVKGALDRLNAALEKCYGERAREARLAAGKDFGVVHLDDQGVRITADQPKRVTWAQAMLSEKADRIRAVGERVEDYLDVEYSIPEARFNNWPPALREQFAAARTVKPGKTSFRLARVDSAPSQE